jgi:hypothetical protein
VALKGMDMVERKEREKDGAWVEAKKEWGVVPVAGGDVDAEKVRPEDDAQTGLWSLWGKEFAFELSKVEGVKGVMTMGTVLAIELEPVGKEKEVVATTGSGEFANGIRLLP